MNIRVMSALRKTATDSVHMEETTEYEPTMGSAIRVLLNAPNKIEEAITQIAQYHTPRYVRDYGNKMSELWGDQATADRHFEAMGTRGKEAIKFLAESANKAGKLQDVADHAKKLDRLYDMAKDIKHEADTKGLNLGAAGSYGASMLGLGALGRLIAGKSTPDGDGG